MDLTIGRRIPLDELRLALEALLPTVLVHLTEDAALAPPCDVLAVLLAADSSDFPLALQISAPMLPTHDFDDWLRDLAAALSVSLRTRVLCDGTGYGDDPSPFWSLVWDVGQPFLADDSDSDPVDGHAGPIRIVRALELQPAALSLSARVVPTRRRH